VSATAPGREPRASIRVLRALYRSALRLYPQRVRELYGAEQWEVTVERARELPRSSLAVARFWLRELGALLRSVRAARRDERRSAARGRSRTGGGALLLDARFVLRSLRARPAYAALAVLALALGIGANTALFSIARGVFLRPLPVAGEDRLVAIWELNVSQNPSGDRWEIAPATSRTTAGAAGRSKGSGATSTRASARSEPTAVRSCCAPSA